MDDALLYWNDGAPSKGLMVPLKDWSKLFKRSDYSTEQQKHSNIKYVAEEFMGHCKGDWDLFEISYPGLRYQYSKLLKEIRKARIARGTAKPRIRNSPSKVVAR